MKKYRVVILKTVYKDMRRLPRTVVVRLKKSIGLLAENPWPSGVKQIEDHPHHFRVRVGNYRIVYEVAKTIRIVRVVKVGHRRDVYR